MALQNKLSQMDRKSMEVDTDYQFAQKLERLRGTNKKNYQREL